MIDSPMRLGVAAACLPLCRDALSVGVGQLYLPCSAGPSRRR
jgi:hypothetical protein